MGEPTSLAALEASFEREARLDQSYVVLTVAASLIATLGLLADSAAVVIGAMLIAPWILPLRSASFAILEGRLALVGRALLTLADRKSTRLNSSHSQQSRMPSSA